MFLLQKYTSNSNTVTLKENLYKKDTHLPSQRTWQIKTLTRIPLDSEIQDSLLNSMILKSFDNILYVVDYADMKIKRFSSTGRFIDKFGKNIGRGPSDFLQILDFSVYGNTLTAIDKTYTAKKFLLNSENSHKTVKLKNFTYRVVSSKDEFITLGFTQELFKTYGVNDSIKVSFGELSDMQFANIFGFGGYLTLGREDDIFIYAPRFASYLIFYSVDGRYIKSIQTIDRMEFQKPIRNEYGIRVPDSHISTSGIAVNKVHIFIEYLRKEIKNSDNALQVLQLLEIRSIQLITTIEKSKLSFFPKLNSSSLPSQLLVMNSLWLIFRNT